MTATTATPDLTALTEEELVAMVATFADDDAMLDTVLAEIDSRDADHEPTEQERMRDLVAQERIAGEPLTATTDRMYGEETYRRYILAENECRATLLNKAAMAAGIDAYTLFHGPARFAAKHASRELLDWFVLNGRETWIEHRYRLLGRSGDAAAAARAARSTQDFIR